MTEIKEMVSSLVNTTEVVKGANALMKNKVIGACPNCGTNVVEREKGWFCENRECRFALWKDNAYFKRLGKHLDGRVVDKLLRDGRVRLKDCKSAKGKTCNRFMVDKRYLKEHHPIRYNQLLLSGVLGSYLAKLDKQTEEQLALTVRQMQEAEGVTEALKAADQLEWVRRMNSIRNRAEEIIQKELIFI